jgi:hypothetical protein
MKKRRGKIKVKKRATGGIRRLLLTNPLNSQLDTNVLIGPRVKKWICLPAYLFFKYNNDIYLIISLFVNTGKGFRHS